MKQRTDFNGGLSDKKMSLPNNQHISPGIFDIGNLPVFFLQNHLTITG